MPTSNTDYYLVDVFNSYLLSLYPTLLNSLAKGLIAILIIFAGWLISYFFKLVVELLIERIKVKEFLAKVKLDQYFQVFEFEEKVSKILGDAIFWFIFIIFFMSATDILGLTAVSSFLKDLLYFIPRVVTGILVILAGFILGDLSKRILSGFLKGLERKSAEALTSLTKFAIVVFSIIAALNQWGIATELINTLMFGLVIFFGLAGGLAFGLGGQDIAREILENWRKKLR